MKQTLKIVITYFSLILSFMLLLTISSVFPSKYIKTNVEQSSRTLMKEGNTLKKEVIGREKPMEFDNYTDALMINTAYSIDNKTPLYSSFVARKNYIPGITEYIYEDTSGELKSASKYKRHNEVGELANTVNGEKLESFEYARYWHGYLVVLRPLLLIANLEQIRIIFTILLLLLFIIFVYFIYKKINFTVSAIFAMGLISIEYFYLGFSMQGIFIFFITMISSIILLAKNGKMENLSIFFFAIGMLTNFFDFLTVPMVTYAIPMILHFLLKQKEEKVTVKNVLIDSIKYGMLWGIGYGLTWIIKWILVDFIYNKDIVKTAIAQVFYRSIGTNKIKFSGSIKRNFEYEAKFLPITMVITFIIIDIELAIGKLKIKANKFNIKLYIIEILPYLILGVMPIIWYTILKDHSYKHAFFTYRNILITNICADLFLEKIFEMFTKSNKKMIESRKK